MKQYVFTTKIVQKVHLNIVLLIIIFSLLQLGILAADRNVKKCSKEVELNGNYRLEWDDPGGSFRRDVVVFSTPKCLDLDGNFLFRICTKNGWISPNRTCHHVENSTICPENFFEHDDYCINITVPRAVDQFCPIPGGTYIDKLDIKKFIWLPLRRIDRYSAYKLLTLGSKYQKRYEQCNSKCCNSSAEFVENCAAANATCIQDVSCDSKYPHMCAYKYDHFLYKCPYGCKGMGLGKNYCFCKYRSEGMRKIKRDDFCKDIAEPDGSSLEIDIIRDLLRSDTCWIKMKNVEKLTKKYPGINRKLINLYNDSSLYCAICRVDPVEISKPEMMLTFEERTRKLYLRVFHPKSLFRSEDGKSVYCFVNRSLTDSDKVDVDEIWDSDEDEGNDELSRPFKIYKVSIITDTENLYWCESFMLPEVKRLITYPVKAYKKVKGCRFTSRILFKNYCSFMEKCKKNIKYSDFNDMLQNIFDHEDFSSIWKAIAVVNIFEVDEIDQNADLLVHFIAEKCEDPEKLIQILESVIKIIDPYVNVFYIRSVDYCLPEITNGLFWTFTSAGSTVLPTNVCIQENSYPVTRSCYEDYFHGSYWLPVSGKCSGKELSEATKELLKFCHNTSNDTAMVFKNVSKIIQEIEKTNIVDTFAIGKILFEMSTKTENISKEDLEVALNIIDDISDFDDDLLKNAQEILNSTDLILDAIERLVELMELKYIDNNYWLIKRKNLVTLITYPLASNITGLVVHGEEMATFLDVEVDLLFENTTVDDLMLYQNFQIGTFISNETLSQLISQNNISNFEDFKIAINIYYRESFFQTDSDKVKSKIISVSIPGFENLLPFSIPVLFKSSNGSGNQAEKDKRCAYWNYGKNAPRCKGRWSSVGAELSKSFNHSIDSCVFSHLTHFALLVTNTEIISPNNSKTQNSDDWNLQIRKTGFLEWITIIGCSLSISGIFGIYVTALTFPSWRGKTGNKILLQLSNTILLMIVGLYAWDLVSSKNKTWCVILGVSLHYSILSKFSWMLVSAFLQFYRFVIVIGPMPSHVLLKSMIVGYLFPIIPVSAILIIYHDAYGSEMCYPRNNALYFGVLLPILSILTVNVYVFVTVMTNVRKSNSNKFPSAHNSKRRLNRELCLAVLLLFLLGLPWFFGLMIELTVFNDFLHTTFSYLFCIFGTVEGFVLFLFYIILDSGTRQMWCRYIKTSFYNKLLQMRKKQTNSFNNCDQSTKDSSRIITNNTNSRSNT